MILFSPISLYTAAASAAVLRRCISLRNYSDYLRKAKTVKKFLERIDTAAAEDAYESAKYIVTFDGNPLVTGNVEHSKLHLRMLTLPGHSFVEILEKLGEQQIEPLKHKSMLLDIVDGTEQQSMPIYGLPLQHCDVSNPDNMASDYCSEQLGNQLHGEFVSGRFAVAMLRSDAERNLIAKMLAITKWCKTFRYCPRCAEPLTISLTALRASCIKCKKYFYPMITPVAICLITDQANTHALLVRHPRNPKSVFTCVAGFAEIGEPLTKTVQREVAEEVGVECRDVTQLNMSQYWPFPDGSLMFACRAIAEQSQEIVACQEELLSAQWFSREQIRTAYENTVADPTMTKYQRDTANQFHYIPPFGTIAHRIIKSWLDGSIPSTVQFQ